MASIIIADDGIMFDGLSTELGPLGGAESSVIALSEALAARGHKVTVYNMCKVSLLHNGVQWKPLSENLPETADLYIANRGDKLLNYVPNAKKVIFWIHNPAKYLLKWRYISKLWKRRPTIVFIGDTHASTLPIWVPNGGLKVIPYGLADVFYEGKLINPPPPRAIFTSNPLRGLDWLLDRWVFEIYPHVKSAELHIYSGSMTYGKVGDQKSKEMNIVLDRAKRLTQYGVTVRQPISKKNLAEELSKTRCMLYRGDFNETFCLAIGEAQAMGVPCVVTDLGAMRERVISGKTGFIASNEKIFSESAKRLLIDDKLWSSQHCAALQTQRNWRWRDAAQRFEEFIGK